MPLQTATDTTKEEHVSETHDAPQSEKDSTDDKVVALLRKVHEYETLVSGSWRDNYIEAFYLLSRANYNSLRRFGVEMLDMRPRDATFVVQTGQGLFTPQTRASVGPEAELVGLPKQNGTLRQRKRNDGSDQAPNDTDSKGDSRYGPFAADTVPANADPKLDSKSEPSKPLASDPKSSNTFSFESLSLDPLRLEKPLDLLRDPLRQFGPLVPPQLRQAQVLFTQALRDSVQVGRLSREIQELLQEIDAGK